MTEATQAQTITVDNVQHDLSSFPVEIQKLVSIHQNWEGKLIEKRMEMAMVEAAVRDLTRELSGKIKEHFEAQIAAATAEVEPVEAEATEVAAPSAE